MIKRLRKLVCPVMLLVLTLTGCGSQIPDLTETQREAISEYAVQLLLKYDTNQNSRLVDLDMLEQEPEATKSPKPVTTQSPAGMDETQDTPVIDLIGEESGTETVGNVHAALGLDDNISIEYVACRTEEQYVDEMSQELVIEATEGKVLFVCDLVLINDGSQKQSVDMLQNNIQYALRLDNIQLNCMVTMLSNDLTTYLGILDSDQSQRVVVLTEVEKEKLEQAEEICLYVQSEMGQGMIPIK
ncbi:MAG: hypothetical protein IKK33_15780 [Lachnospiraceae bacterium]|nr:hypothetical protein [Lachnospiraceae bacterium]